MQTTTLSETAKALLRSRVMGGTREVNDSNREAYRELECGNYVRSFRLHQRAGISISLDGRGMAEAARTLRLCTRRKVIGCRVLAARCTRTGLA